MCCFPPISSYRGRISVATIGSALWTTCTVAVNAPSNGRTRRPTCRPWRGHDENPVTGIVRFRAVHWNTLFRTARLRWRIACQIISASTTFRSASFRLHSFRRASKRRMHSANCCAGRRGQWVWQRHRISPTIFAALRLFDFHYCRHGWPSTAFVLCRETASAGDSLRLLIPAEFVYVAVSSRTEVSPMFSYHHLQEWSA